MTAISGEAAGRTWLLLAFGDDRSYGGNRGYLDDPRAVYRFDNFVQNHKQLRVGDRVIVRNQQKMLGIGRVELIDKRAGIKVRQSCPACGRSALVPRKHKTPNFYCSRCKHEFDSPVVSEVDCILYSAHFGSTFVDAVDAIGLDALRAASLRYSGQVAMQRVDESVIVPSLLMACPRVALLYQSERYPTAEDADDAKHYATKEEVSNYEPEHDDLREAVLSSIRRRRGQQKFRSTLRQQYEDKCAITRCSVVDLLEAAHIAPYRGVVDNNSSNGLLLRADIHTLFDLDLLGVSPQTLCVHVHESLVDTEYRALRGIRIAPRADGAALSEAALILRWQRFLVRSAVLSLREPKLD